MGAVATEALRPFLEALPEGSNRTEERRDGTDKEAGDRRPIAPVSWQCPGESHAWGCADRSSTSFAKICHDSRIAGMGTMNISLPDGLQSSVDEQVATRGYGTSSEFMRDLIRRDQDRQPLHGLLLEGAASAPDTPAEEAFFDSLRTRDGDVLGSFSPWVPSSERLAAGRAPREPSFAGCARKRWSQGAGGARRRS